MLASSNTTLFRYYRNAFLLMILFTTLFCIFFLNLKNENSPNPTFSSAQAQSISISPSNKNNQFEKIPKHQHKLIVNRSEILNEAVKRMRNLPREYLNLEQPSKRFNESCAVMPSILDVEFLHSSWQIANTPYGNLFIYGAYYDNRKLTMEEFQGPVVRILGVMEHYLDSNTITNYCQLWFEDEDMPAFSQIIDQKYIWRDRWGTNSKYHPYLFACPVPEKHLMKIPISVSLVMNKCDNALNHLRVQYDVQSPRKDFAVCVKGLDFLMEDNSMRLVEWIELQRILGADKIFFYEYVPVHPNVSKVLRFYEATGFVDVTPYSLLGFLPNDPLLRHLYLTSAPRTVVNARTEIVTYNDCLYRNLYNFKFLVVIDTDEVIMPLRYFSTWHDIVQNIQEKVPNDFESFAGISFQNVYFLDTWMENLPRIPEIPSYMYHLQHIYRANNYSEVGHATKCFHQIERIVSMHNHFPRECFGKCKGVNLPSSMAQLQHYKSECPAAIPNCTETVGKDPVVDTTIWRYKNELIRNSEKVYKILGFIPDTMS